MNTTLEGLEDKERLDGSAEYRPPDHPIHDDDYSLEISEDDGDDPPPPDDGPPPGGGAVEAKPKAYEPELNEHGVRPPTHHYSDKTVSPKGGDGVIYFGDRFQWVKLGRRGYAYDVGEDGRKLVFDSSRPRGHYSVEEWKKLPSKKRTEIIKREKEEKDAEIAKRIKDRKKKEKIAPGSSTDKKKTTGADKGEASMKKKKEKGKSKKTKKEKKEKGEEVDVEEILDMIKDVEEEEKKKKDIAVAVNAESVKYASGHDSDESVPGIASDDDSFCPGYASADEQTSPKSAAASTMCLDEFEEYWVEWDEWAEVEGGFGPQATWNQDEVYNIENGAIAAVAEKEDDAMKYNFLCVSVKNENMRTFPLMPCVATCEVHREKNVSSPPFHFNAAVARPVGRKEMLGDPTAYAAMQKEWKGQHDAGVYDFTKVREYDDVVREAKRNGAEIHMARVHGICVEKNHQLPKGGPRRKFKGRGVLLGNQVKNQNWEAAFFQDLGNSPASFEASRWVDFYGCLPGHGVKLADAIQAYIQAVLTGPACWVELPEDAWPDSVDLSKFRRPMGG